MSMQPPGTPGAPPPSAAAPPPDLPPAGMGGGAPAPDASGGNFFTRPIIGIPVWGWLAIIAGGALIAFYIVPRFFSAQATPATDGGTTSPPTAGDGTASTTGSQATAMPDQNTLLQALAQAQGAAGSAGTPGFLPSTSPPTTTGGDTGPVPQYITVSRWTAKNTPWNSYLAGIASHYGVSMQRIKNLNPQVHNWLLIQPGQQIRVT